MHWSRYNVLQKVIKMSASIALSLMARNIFLKRFFGLLITYKILQMNMLRLIDKSK